MPLKKEIVHWLMKQNIIGYFTHSDCVMVENVLIDEDSISKHHKRGMGGMGGMGVGVYTLFPLTTDEKTRKNTMLITPVK